MTDTKRGRTSRISLVAGRRTSLSSAIAALALAACGGGGGDTAPPPQATQPPASPSLVTSVPDPTYSVASPERVAFETLNGFRGHCGFGLLRQDPRLDVSAKMYPTYVLRGAEVGDHSWFETPHIMQPGKPGYTASTPEGRAALAGFPTNQFTGESFAGIGSDASPAEKARVNIGMLASTVYHGVHMFGPNTLVGIGQDEGMSTQYLAVHTGVGSDFRGQSPAGLVTFPCQGSTGVRGRVEGEWPDPIAGLAASAGWTYPFGTPVFLMAPTDQTLVVSSYTIAPTAGGPPVEAALLNKATDPHQRLRSWEVFILPRYPLVNGASYSVQVSGTLDGKPFATAFQFTTDPHPFGRL